jgi:hypothetical protein
MPSSFKCHTCGQVHDELPLSFGADAPVHYYGVPEDERQERTLLSSDQCVIDDEHYETSAKAIDVELMAWVGGLKRVREEEKGAQVSPVCSALPPVEATVGASGVLQPTLASRFRFQHTHLNSSSSRLLAQPTYLTRR